MPPDQGIPPLPEANASAHALDGVPRSALSRLCFDASRSASASWIAKAFTDSGLPLRRNTINQWAARGKLLSTGRKDGSPQYLYSDVYRLALAPNSSAAQATSALRQTLLQRVASLVARRAYMLCGERSAENL